MLTDNKLWNFVKRSITPLGMSRPTIFYGYGVEIISTTLDLHGMTVQEAYDRTKSFIDSHSTSKSIHIITGKSGQIKKEFPEWLRQNSLVKSFEEENHGGAYRIKIKA